MRLVALPLAVAFDSLKAHIYDHCPYCTRVELVLGWHGLPYERVVYGYSDVAGPVALTGKKLLPVITWSQGEVMGESVEIIKAKIEGTRGKEVLRARNRSEKHEKTA